MRGEWCCEMKESLENNEEVQTKEGGNKCGGMSWGTKVI